MTVETATHPKAARFIAIAEKLRPLTATHDRRENTPKQRREAAMARFEACNAQHALDAAEALADGWAFDDLPADLRTIAPTKASLIELTERALDYSRMGYYDVVPTDNLRSKNPIATSLRHWVEMKRGVSNRAEKLRRENLYAECARKGIPGFFPTPAHAVERMIELANLHLGDTVLEPSAGRGDIVRALPSSVEVHCVEINHTLRQILSGDGFDLLAEPDFLELEVDPAYDVVLMNPPFEKRHDEVHIRRAWDFLKPGGRLVALCSPGAVQNARSADFREWLDEIGADYSEAVDGFETTGVTARLIFATKPE